MALQKSVSLYPAAGFAGQEVVTGQAVYAAFNPLSDGTVESGGFAFIKENDGAVTVSKTGSTGDIPVGIVERILDNTIVDVTADSSVVYPEGAVVTIAIRGQFYIKAPAAGKSGQKISIDPTTGALTFEDTVSSGSDTGWTVVAQGGAKSFVADDIVIAQNFG